MELNGTIGERLTELMEEHGTDVKTLARQMNADPTTVRRWKRGATSLRAEQLIRLAELYSCSLEFLAGRSDRECGFSPKACPSFYSHFRALLQRKGVSRCEIHRNTRAKSSHFDDWKRGSMPSVAMLLELADYLHVTLDVLVGRETE